jgi:hypothetical protein
MASILGKPGGPGQFPTHDLSTVRGALHAANISELFGPLEKPPLAALSFFLGC